MSLMELFRSYSKRNTCNTNEIKGVTPTVHEIQGHITHNTCNTEKDKVWQKNESEITAIMRAYYYRVTDKPDSELTVCTDHSFEEVRESLLLRYGDKLLSVYPSQLLHCRDASNEIRY